MYDIAAKSRRDGEVYVIQLFECLMVRDVWMIAKFVGVAISEKFMQGT